ncbi:MAG: endonuclease MutS2 [Firmicutes bacterium]|nr:endonuclease MutS2 [Bacillota bacterium]
MNDKTFRVLEYDKIINLLMEKTAAEMTKKLVSALRPSKDIAEIRESLAETTEAARVIVLKGAAPLGAFYDIEKSLHLSRKGATLTMKQLLEVLYNVKVARNVSVFLKSDLPPLPIIGAIAEVISVQKRLEENIDRCILSEDEMSDNASPELRKIRMSIVRKNEDIRARINNIINSSANKTLLQDAIVTMRDGRYVIPVKQEHRSKFPGIIHDQSQSGATLFVEPQVIVTMNNELRELEIAEKVEIERILAELSGNVAEHFHELMNNQKLLLKLDFIFAKGKLSSDMGGEEPQMNEEGYLELKEARHPLIDKKKVVPTSLRLGGEYTTLVITGPNTGGKTVTLKTAGLLSMMAQSGHHIPASSGSKLPVFSKIYADIGDEQSIEQNLSTFSSHMTNIVGITEEADDETLVLVDELGGGTDPTEGAALAISVLDFLKTQGTKIIATTHYNELKKYAISTPGVMNASMQFDVETLSPTYKLIIGAPGRSNAFEISEKLGLSDFIIERARLLLESGDIEFEDVISAIEADRKAAEEDRDEALMLNIAMKKQKEELDAYEAKLKAQRDKIIQDAHDEARSIIRETKELSKEVQAELKELARLDSMGERNKRYEESRKRIKKAEGKHERKIVVDTNHEPVDATKIKIGSRVKLMTIGQNGEVLSLPDDKGDLQLQIGIMKVNANIKDLMLIDQGSSAPKKKTGGTKYGAMYRAKTMNVGISINVQGKNLDDAVMDVDKYLDDAFIAGLETVTVIHGRGEGILQKGLRDMLKKHKHVDSFRKGAYNEGGDGVTIVKLKK